MCASRSCRTGRTSPIGIFQVRSLEPAFGTAEWGFALASEFWGAGIFMDGAKLIVDFAFDVLGVHRLEARAALKNGRGNGALRKLGAVQEGVLRRSFLRNGEYLDQALWTILQDEWRGQDRLGHARHPLTLESRTFLDVRDFDFDLPAELIAQEPPTERGGSRLLSLNRATGALTHSTIAALPDLLEAGDVLVINNTRVFPARLIGRRVPSGGRVECLLIGHASGGRVGGSGASGPEVEAWRASRVRRCVSSGNTLRCEILERRFHGRRLVRLWTDDGVTVDEAVDAIGHVPLPPYIKRDDRDADRDRYQTIFARSRGSIAAPTAGLHFTPALVAACAARGVEIAEITLHVGYGTFQPVRVEHVEDHRIEPERYEIGPAAADAINAALAGRRRDRGRRHDDDAHARSRRARARRPDRRRHGSGRPVHLSWLRLSRRVRAADELSSPADRRC